MSICPRLDRRSIMNSRNNQISAVLMMGLLAAACGKQEGKTTMKKPTAQDAATASAKKSGHLAVNGLSYYYEIHGEGEPILLLHGGLGSIDMFRPLLPKLAAGRQIIAVDLHGHGRTSLGDRDISLVDMGDDMAKILEQLGYGQVDVLGYSMGGGVAFRLAVQHPDAVRRLVLVSAGFAQDGFYPEMLPMQAQVGAPMAEAMKDTPMYKSYVAVAPHPEDFPKLLDRMGALMRKPYTGPTMSRSSRCRRCSSSATATCSGPSTSSSSITCSAGA